jgi:hypothetical protein
MDKIKFFSWKWFCDKTSDHPCTFDEWIDGEMCFVSGLIGTFVVLVWSVFARTWFVDGLFVLPPPFGGRFCYHLTMIAWECFSICWGGHIVFVFSFSFFVWFSLGCDLCFAFYVLVWILLLWIYFAIKKTKKFYLMWTLLWRLIIKMIHFLLIMKNL